MARRAKIIPDYGQIVRDNYEKAIEIDSMPSGGQRSRRGTDFQIRRHAQIAFLQKLWPSFFPNHAIPNHAELADLLGWIKTDSVGDALYVLEEGAKRQHIGRGVYKRNRDGTPKTDENGKVLRTKRKIDNMVSFLRPIARKMFGSSRESVEDDIPA